jgi:hypothetical protein
MSNYYNLVFKEIKVNLSTPAIMRARCKKCGARPSKYYRLQEREFIKDIKVYSSRSLRNKNFIKKMNSDWHLDFYPSTFHSIYFLSYSPLLKGYNPHLHINNRANSDSHYPLTEFLTCSCGQTTWSWKDINHQDVLEHKHRRSRGYYDAPLLHE